MATARRLTDVITHHGEGPGWHARDGVLRLVDMLAGDLVTLAEDGVQRAHLAPVVAAWRERSAGGMVVALERGFALLDPVGHIEWSIEVWDDPGVRMNDGACDPQGRFLCGSMAYDARPGAGSLWRLDPDRRVHRVLDRLTVSNGMVWSPDGEHALHIDTPRGRVDSYPVDPLSGTFGSADPWAVVEGGAPDGMAMDADGGIWVAIWGGNAVHRYDEDGALSAVVSVDARQVTACAFGGPHLDLLYITTSRQDLAEGDDPAAGSVFVADVGVRGAPLLTFTG